VPLITFFLPSHVLINHNDVHRIILMGSNRLPQWLLSLYLVLPLNIFGVVYAIALCGFRYRDIHHSLLHFCYQLLFTVHDKIIMLMGT
jgi:ABC-type polysaccharide/polyol phosphate export permease